MQMRSFHKISRFRFWGQEFPVRTGLGLFSDISPFQQSQNISQKIIYVDKDFKEKVCELTYLQARGGMYKKEQRNEWRGEKTKQTNNIFWNLKDITKRKKLFLSPFYP